MGYAMCGNMGKYETNLVAPATATTLGDAERVAMIDEFADEGSALIVTHDCACSER